MDKIIQGDAYRTLLLTPEKRFQTCVTSPPYFGLRDYGVDGQIGLEETPDEYVRQLVNVLREVWRTLKDDGTLWLNLGDSYASQGRTENSVKYAGYKVSKAYEKGGAIQRVPQGLKPKDLIGIPWRVAFALQADGWYLRQDIIWHKPNPMPESVTDRCTKAHEYIFLLSKSERYYFDHEAIKEPTVDIASIGRRTAVNGYGSGEQANGNRFGGGENGRNKRSVWTVTTKPYKGAHFATFPSDLIEPCILAGSKAGDLVLDPFFGSGTTGAVAKSLGRHYYGIELNPEYIKLAEQRLADTLSPQRTLMEAA